MKAMKLNRVFFGIVSFCLLAVASSFSVAKEEGAGQGMREKPPPATVPDSFEVSAGGEEALEVHPAQTTIEGDEPEKRILISLADKRMWVFENDQIVQRFPVSTGVAGHRTPTGHFRVHYRSPRAFSRRYKCYMLHWMAITSDGMIGMHALEGHAYERLLGRVASHGCIRLSHVNAEWLYNWVEIGTPVEIVADWEEPPPSSEPPQPEDYPFHW